MSASSTPDKPGPGVFPAAGPPLLSIEDLHVEFSTGNRIVRAVEGLSYTVNPGEIVAVVGESGSGKSVSALSIMRLLPRQSARITKGRIMFDGRDLASLDNEAIREVRGRDISMIFQEPMTSLNPVLPIGLQIMEPLQIHLGMNEEQCHARAIELMRLVGIPDAESRLDQYPHQFSGGMRQRVMIAIGLACNPKLIIADEPTTALDVTISAQILELMKDLSRRLNIALILITHNLAVVARYADRVVVMYAARMAEQGSAEAVFRTPRHPYTMGLLHSVPRLDRPRDAKLATIEGMPPNLAFASIGCRFAPRCPHRLPACEASPPPLVATDTGGWSACLRANEIAAGKIRWLAPDAKAATHWLTDQSLPLLELRGLTKHFTVRTGFFKTALVRAVEDVSFTIHKGETLGLVGESGCGKTTIGRLVLRLDDPTSGEIRFAGQNLLTASPAELALIRRKVQVIFQDPYSSLNPRMTVGQIVGEPLRVHKIVPSPQVSDRIAELLSQVGLGPELADRYPHQLSGGQRQRVGIARALAFAPSFIVCDEAVSALDVSIQGQIINLLEDLQRAMGLAYLFIAHDLAVVRHLSTRVIVMYLGRIMEVADRDTLYSDPQHPYTQALLQAVPVPDPESEHHRPRSVIAGEIPSPLNPPSGCVFRTRCTRATEDCKVTVPTLRPVGANHLAACINL